VPRGRQGAIDPRGCIPVDGGAAGAAAAAAIIAEAIKASGAIVRVDPENFAALIARAGAPLVVTATGGLFSKHIQYLTSYKGLVFFTKSAKPLSLPPDVELIVADKIWIPG